MRHCPSENCPVHEIQTSPRRATVFSIGTILLAVSSANSRADEPSIKPNRPKIIVGFTSFRDDIRYTNVFRYELSPSGEGKVTGKVTPGSKRSDHHLSLSTDGRLGVFAGEVVGKVNEIHLWDFDKKAARPLPSLNVTTTAQMAPVFHSSGLITFEAWRRPGSYGRWDVLMYDVAAKQLVDLPRLNSAKFDERKPSISQDANWIAYTTNESIKTSLTDIRLYDRRSERVLELPSLNSIHMDTEPSISQDGRLIAFVSDRPGGAGARDIYLYDRELERLVPTPRLNSAGQEQSPAISADGRFIAFVSERLTGAGERDIYLYDRSTQSLVATPDLNRPGDEYDPCIITLSQ